MRQPDHWIRFVLVAHLAVAGLLGTQQALASSELRAPTSASAPAQPAASASTDSEPPLRFFNPQVLALYDAYEQQLQRVRKGGWPQVLTTQTLRPGMEHPAVFALRERLRISGDWEVPLPTTVTAGASHGLVTAAESAAEQSGPTHFDDLLAAAVTRFQRRHGLTADGIVGPGTRAALNISAITRLRQLALNIARWDALRSNFDDAFVLVNMPEFQLELYQAGSVRLDMRVVIGKPRNPTPQMVQQMEKFVLNPTWFVPRTIGARELLPKVQQDLGYLARQQFEVFQGRTPVDPASVPWETLTSKGFKYSFRQRPGPENSLGKVKFVLPNHHSIFLHDTPHKSLFDENHRAFSHGCVRVEEPLALARAVLGLQSQWTEDKVDRQLRSKRTVHLQLERPVPVYLAYLTAKVSDGTVMFFNDVYGHDAQPLEQSVLPSELVATLSQLRTVKRARERSPSGQPVLVAASAGGQ